MISWEELDTQYRMWLRHGCEIGEAGRRLSCEFPYNGKTWLRWLIAMPAYPQKLGLFTRPIFVFDFGLSLGIKEPSATPEGAVDMK